MQKQMEPRSRIPRPLVGPVFRLTKSENIRLRAKARAHGVGIAELIRRSVAAYPVRPSVES
jgi:hypothetical protein